MEDVLRLDVDPVTGSQSRAAFDRRLPEALDDARQSQQHLALIAFDVDYFKSVNDAYGHARGDEMLRHVADLVSACVPAGAELFRPGGDEFALLVPGVDRDGGLDVALLVADAVASTPLPGTIALSVSVSLGVAAFPEDGRTAEALSKAADRRNYLAKRRGRGGAVADDVDTGATESGSRLVQRDNAVAAVQRFFDQILDQGTGELTIHGAPGAGHTRFLEEVSRIGRLRGFTVLDRDSVTPADQVLVVQDHGDIATLRRMIGDLRTTNPAPTTIGVVHASRGSEPARAELGLPVSGVVELLPWSSDAIRIWLRTVLRGEPSTRLLTLIHRISRGLPAKARRELDRLTEQGGLRRGDDGSWDLKVAAPPARSPYRVPTPLTELIGRTGETADVAELVTGHRLVTLTGPGGVGKTRLSLAVAGAVAGDFPNGVAFVELEDAVDESGVLGAIARALRISDSGKPPYEAVAELLEDRCVLLVLDNFEQALGAAALLGRLLAAAPEVKALVTSRERLRLYGERVFLVDPLPLPDLDGLPDRAADIPELVAASPALGLFRARASAALHRFALTPDNLPAAAELCHRLDGLPLAIELAAAHSDELTPQQMLAGIVGHLPADGPQDLPGRQRSLRAAIDWSLDLLGEADRTLFDQLGAFADSWTPEAAEAVCAGDAVSQRLTILADKSLLTVTAQPDGTIRYAMLETIRRVATDRLAARPDAGEIRRRHAACYADFAERSAVELTGPDQARWIQKVQRDYANLRAAFTFTTDALVAGRIAVGLWRYWRNGEFIDEGRAWLSAVLAGELPPALRAHALHAAGLLAATQDDYQAAARLGADSLDLATSIGDAVAGAQAVNLLGFAAMGTGDYDAAYDHFTDSLDRWAELDHPQGMATAYGNLTKVALNLGDAETASERAAAAVGLDRRAGNTRGIALGLECLGQIKLMQGDLTGAQRLLLESLSLSRSLGDVFGEAVALHNLGQIADREGDHSTAVGRVTLALELRYEVGDQEGLSASLEQLAALLVDDAPLAVSLLGAAGHIRSRHGLPDSIESKDLSAEVRARTAGRLDPEAAERQYRHGESLPVGQLVEHLTTIAPDARV